MRLERLQITNYRRLRDVDVELPDGVIALVGKNGAGKSSLLEALGWCLFGQEASRTEKDLIKRRGAAPSEDVRVHVAFRLGPHVYEVTRELQGRSEAHVASVRVDGKVVVAAGAQSAKEATAYVERLLHMGSAGFFTSVVARQRELAALSDARPAERKRIVMGLLRLDAVDTAIATARQLRRDTRSGLAAARAGLSAEEAAIAGLVDAVEDARTRRESGRKVAQEHRIVQMELASLDERDKDILRQATRLAQEKDQCVRAQAEAAALAPDLVGLEPARETVVRLTAHAERALELARVRDEAARAEADVARALAEAEAARTALTAGATLRALAERVKGERPRQEEALAALQRGLVDKQAQVQAIAREINDVTRDERRIREMGPDTPCPTCTRPLHEHHADLLHGFAGRLADLRSAMARLQPELDEQRQQETKLREGLAALTQREAELRDKLARLESETVRLTNAVARSDEAKGRAARAREREASLTGEPFDPKALEAARTRVRVLDAAQQRHATLVATSARLPQLEAALAEVEAARLAAKAKREEATARMARLGFDPKAHELVEAEAAAVEQRLTDARVRRERLAGEVARRQEEERRVVEEQARQAELAAQAAALEVEARQLEHLAGDRDVGLLPEFKDDLVSRIRPLLSHYAGSLFREMTDGRYADLEVDEDYDVLVHDDGEAFALARFSGGESDLANLCVRLAVSQVVAERSGGDGLGFLALDEVFGSQDETRKANILRALQALSGRFRQILVITHVPDVNDAAEHVLRVVAEDDGTSRVVLEGAA